MSAGSIILEDDGNGMITASIGRTTGNLRDTILALAQRQDALEREL